jgi:hypothetical protein
MKSEITIFLRAYLALESMVLAFMTAASVNGLVLHYFQTFRGGHNGRF